MTAVKPYSPACDRNREPILAELTLLLAGSCDQPLRVLEIGSGTGQHAAYFAQHIANKNIIWQTSDLAEHLPGIEQWLVGIDTARCPAPIELDLNRFGQLPQAYDAVFTANTLHIVSWALVERFFQGVSSTLTSGGQCIVYGPFNYNGHYTSDSNRDFDVWLRQRDTQSGIRDIESVVELALRQATPLDLIDDIAMPANNRLLVFQKR